MPNLGIVNKKDYQLVDCAKTNTLAQFKAGPWCAANIEQIGKLAFGVSKGFPDQSKAVPDGLGVHVVRHLLRAFYTHRQVVVFANTTFNRR